jgi:hypothetical protein
MTSHEWAERLEAQKAAMLARVSAWPAELQTRNPVEGEWSALQVLDHLVRTERGMCAMSAKGLAAPQKIGVKDRVGFAMVERVFRSRRRVKVPEPVKHFILPGEGLELRRIEDAWGEVRETLAKLMCEAEGCRDGVFRHPVGGWMSFGQVLRFFSVHMVHHGYQLERIESALGITSRSR